MKSSLARTLPVGGRSLLLPSRPATSFFLRPGWRRSLSVTAARRDAERQWTTPLAKQLTEAINMTGPVPLASFMRMCLTADVGGYYTGAIEQGRDQFGQRGDFITSPEISQVFGELIGIWFVAEWMSQGKPKAVELIEVGPGRGTLMDDMLRTMKNFPSLASNIEAIYMVEASKELREAQKNLLCGKDAVMEETKAGWRCTSKYLNLPIIWAETIKGVPQSAEKTPFIVAHEFFDALPIHAFQVVNVPAPKQAPETDAQLSDATSTVSAKVRDGSKSTGGGLQWREMVVSPVPEGTTHGDLGTPKSEQHAPVPEFQMTLSPSVTRHSKYLPEMSPRYKALKNTEHALIEVCPDASLYASEFATRIGGDAKQPKPKPSGAALILDYGPLDTIPLNSLRGIRQHKRVSPFSEPGLVDLSVDVDFMGIAEAALKASEGVEVHGPVDQAGFLEAMGISERAAMLAKKTSPERAKDIERAWKRLVDRGPGGMGKLYKALAILPENDGRRKPVGFGGDVSP
ncbi:S-adenosyl-L-methionine-dependent methyltransferase [Microdochium trichocladiopsis]|uniref:Protein arginine methyltransferase NDUFAF7 n=1 Tax=Microdochium trichocladiopsis TaxID=1682393 RepID=A0A9P9BY95_9PEZI|nr:S-adenosyl-L-methionine-dependent methyltransferase [Microdochium trichocladiopsis]KAH7037843.1 S-adenosyl-L-methionine-dependent methyltransferase [Microdochium trichocladiopsis]